jgi:hypothetical protein
MIGYILTNNQYLQIQDVFYTEYQFFNCVKDINNVWYLLLSAEDKIIVSSTQYNWVLSLPTSEYIPPPPPPFPTL